ncbi:MAG: peptidoglycan DD-metalloendopeptidase family protein [Sphingomonadaceae bacterium]
MPAPAAKPAPMTPVHRTRLGLGLALAAICGVTAIAQVPILPSDLSEARQALAQARKQSNAARQRAVRLEQEAKRVTEQADRTAREGAAVAARIQQAEADIEANEARVTLISGERDALRARLAERQQPLIRLTAALQRLSRRPPALALLRPGTVRDTMYMRAVFDTMLPEIEKRTADLRQEIERGRQIELRAEAASNRLKASFTELKERQERLAAIETRQRLASREATGLASREAERALAYAEKARDLGDLMDEVGKQGRLREELAALPGPIMRPAQPGASQISVDPDPEPSPRATGGPERYMLPLQGRLVAGFGERIEGRPDSKGIVLAARARSQAVAPASGRVAFAGTYSGYGKIVIIEHSDGWTSLVTGLTRLDVNVGERVVAGSPVGLTGPGDPIVTVELRRDGTPVNPLQYVSALT